MPTSLRLSFALMLTSVACGDPGGGPDDDVVDRDGGRAPTVDAAPGADAGEGEDAGPNDGGTPENFVFAPLEPEPTPEGKVRVAIGLAHGRVVTSCDGLESIAHDEVFSPEANDHHEHALKGAAYGGGVYLFNTGHGAPGHVFRSTDGIAWEQLPGERFHYADGSTGPLSGGTRGIFWDGEVFVLIRGRSPRMTSTDGLDWYEDEGEPIDRTYFHFRSLSYHPELRRLFMDGTDSPKVVHWLLSSLDSAQSYAEVEGGFADECNAWMTYAHGGLVAPGGDVMCLSFDGGDTWRVETVPDGFGTYLPTDEGFIAFAGWRRGFQRWDGESWTEETIDNGVRIAAAGRAPWGTYWAASRQGTELWISRDSVTWEPMAHEGSGNPLRMMLFGYADPSEACPLPE